MKKLKTTFNVVTYLSMIVSLIMLFFLSAQYVIVGLDSFLWRHIFYWTIPILLIGSKFYARKAEIKSIVFRKKIYITFLIINSVLLLWMLFMILIAYMVTVVMGLGGLLRI
jgi:hypothetical protein